MSIIFVIFLLLLSPINTWNMWQLAFLHCRNLQVVLGQFTLLHVSAADTHLEGTLSGAEPPLR